jgi:ADP-ribose pyrophosphatase YjhB (NUDIX family)
MDLAAFGRVMPGDGPFLFLREGSSPHGFWHLPEGGMCLSAFLFVRDGTRILLGKYRDHPEWAELAGLEPDRVRRNTSGWTIPASQLKFGEDPREAARRIGERILAIRGLAYSEPRVATELYEPSWLPGKSHYDVSFFVDATPPAGHRVTPPPWYAELAWQDPMTLNPAEYARSHGDVVAMWERLKASRG